MRNSQTLTDFNIHIDGVGFAGVANKLVVPAIAFETIERDVSGMAGSYDSMTGRLKKMDSEIEVDTFTAENIWPIVGGNDSKETPVVFRGSLKDGGRDIALKILLQGNWVEWGGHDFEVKKEIKNKFKISLTKLAIYSDNKEIVYINLPTWDIRLGGTQQGKSIKANLGL